MEWRATAQVPVEHPIDAADTAQGFRRQTLRARLVGRVEMAKAAADQVREKATMVKTLVEHPDSAAARGQTGFGHGQVISLRLRLSDGGVYQGYER